MLDGVLAERNEEPKLKVETLEQAIAEVVPFDHAEPIHGRVPDSKLHPAHTGAARSCGTD